MKAGWPRKKISEIAQHSLGKMLDKAKNKGELQPYLRNLNVRWFDFDLSDVLEMRFLPEEADRYTAVKGDVLVCEGGYPGRAAIWSQDERIYFQKALHRVRFHDPGRNKWFLYYLHLCDLEGTLRHHFNGAGIQHFTGEALSRFELPCPPISEQQRIVALLDEAFDGIATARAKAEKNLQNTRALFESHLQSVFTARGEGWVEKRIEEWCASIMDCVNKTAPVVEGPTPFKMIRTTNVRNGYIDLSTVRFVNEETYKTWTRRQVPQRGDVILTREAPMGEVGMLVTDDQVFLGQRLVSYRANPKILDNHFLLLALQSRGIQDQIRAKASGATVQHMRVPDSKNLLLAAPSLQLQGEIVARLISLREETQHLESLYQRKLAALDELKQSLLHQAFSGQL